MTIYSRRPSASVIIPTYNRSQELVRTLECLARQDIHRSEFEVIVTDDGSSDDTASAAISFAGKLRLKYCYHEDQGFTAAAARNAGARLATADILIFIDGGVLLGPGFVRSHLAEHRPAAHRAVLGYIYGFSPYRSMAGLASMLERCSPEDVVARHRDNPDFIDWRDVELAKHGYDLSNFSVPWMFFFTGNCSVAASDFRAAGEFDEEFVGWGCEDLDLGLRMFKRNIALVVSKNPWVIEVPHDRDISANLASYKANMGRLLAKHPEPAVEIGWLESLRGGMERWEQDYASLAAHCGGSHDTDVAAEIDRRHAEAGRPARVAVIGAGGRLPDSMPPSVVLDFDRELLARATSDGRHLGYHAIGVRTPLTDQSVDAVIITSRLAEFWPRWGEDLVAEARRIGQTVQTPVL
jgi:glycosyltransferase involved in cell wall biosynthesis